MPENPAAAAPARVSLAEVTPPIALGPLDGRYRAAVAPLVDHLSEAALNRERIHVEVEWLITLCNGVQAVDEPAPAVGAEHAHQRAAGSRAKTSLIRACRASK